MTGVYTRRYKNSTSVCIRYSPSGEPRVRERIETVDSGREFVRRLREAKKRAEKVLIRRKAAIVEGRHELARPQASMTFARFVETVYTDELRERGIRTAEKEIQRCTTGPVGRFFGETRLADLTEFRIRQYIKARREGKLERRERGGRRSAGPGALNRDLARLSDLWNAARRRRLVSGENPCRLIGRAKEPPGRVRYLTEDEAARLLEELRPDLRRLVEVGLHTGIRLRALRLLCWEHVDLVLGQLVVPPELDKAKRGYRVGINPRVRAVLMELPRHSSYVFAKADGTPRRSVRRAFQTALQCSGIEDFTFHDLRHTAASRIVMSGGSLYDAKEHLGHRTESMTARYAHLSPKHMQGVAELTMPAPAAARVVELRPKRSTPVGGA